jgi:hypothetical protein
MRKRKDGLAGHSRAHPDETPERAAEMNYYKEREASRRRISDNFEIWRFCEEKPCQRARACRGNPDVGVPEAFRLVPPEQKFWLQKAVEARIGGASVEEACRIADAALAEHERAMRELTARLRGPNMAPPQETLSPSGEGG